MLCTGGSLGLNSAHVCHGRLFKTTTQASRTVSDMPRVSYCSHRGTSMLRYHHLVTEWCGTACLSIRGISGRGEYTLWLLAHACRGACGNAHCSAHLSHILIVRASLGECGKTAEGTRNDDDDWSNDYQRDKLTVTNHSS